MFLIICSATDNGFCYEQVSNMSFIPSSTIFKVVIEDFKEADKIHGYNFRQKLIKIIKDFMMSEFIYRRQVSIFNCFSRDCHHDNELEIYVATSCSSFQNGEVAYQVCRSLEEYLIHNSSQFTCLPYHLKVWIITMWNEFDDTDTF